MMLHRLLPRLLLSLILACTLGLAGAQDIHFTLHHMTPLAFNPANTGGFYGSYRISGLYRDQYRSIAQNGAFVTPTFSIDAPIIRGFREKDWVGVGIFFYADQSGTAGLSVNAYKLSAAYHFALTKKGNSILTLGYQTGGVQRRIKNISALQFEDGLLIGMPDQSMDLSLINPDEKGKNFLDHVGGLKLTSKFNKTDEFSIGVAAGKFGRPDWSLLTSGGNFRVDPRLHVQVGMSSLVSDKIRFSPSVSYQKILKGAANTLVVQGLVDYLFSEEKRITMKGGLGYRSGANIGDAVQLMLGADVKDIRVMIAYDFTISSLSRAGGTQGAFELAAQYLGRIYKRPKPDPIIFCPRF